MKMSKLTLGSLFDGSGGFPLGGLLCGITPVWSSEIEPFAVRVTTKRLPKVKHYGDVSALSGEKLPPVDIITFGSPCQDMSIAGKRAGLDGSRSNLFYEAVRIIKEMRDKTNGKYPRFIVWENVPGAFSSNGGEDFKAVLESVCSVKEDKADIPRYEKWPNAGYIMADGYSVAWRVLDAQFWGVPQRRKRIYLVADFTGGSAAKILFESEGLSGNFKKGGFPWQRTAAGAEKGTGATGTVCLNDQGGNNQPFVVENTKRYDVRFTSEGTKNARQNCYETETARTIDTGGNAPDSNQGGVAVVYGICSKGSNSMKSDNPHSGIYKADTARTIDANGGNPSCNQGGMAVVCVDQGGGKSSCQVSKEVAPTLACTHGGEPAVCVQGSMIGRKDENEPNGSGVNEDISFTLMRLFFVMWG